MSGECSPSPPEPWIAPSHREPLRGARRHRQSMLKGYPRLSETFIAQELAALERRGVALALFSLRRPTDTRDPPGARRDRARRSSTCPEYLRDEPRRVLRAWLAARRLPGYRAALAAWRRGPPRATGPRTARAGCGQALVLAAELPADVGHLHAHFLHTPASVTRYAAAMRGLPWSVSAHAEGHLDHARVGEAREARLVRLGDHVHAGECACTCARSPATRPQVDLDLPRASIREPLPAAGGRAARPTGRPERPW
ncbi:MAG: hypothetical protein MZW92_32385 [Comamonadaceae bacterium]|nr:hypothetical protein [Comamonadaceae bacterium]